MNRIVFLCSGAGGNFHFIRAAIANGLLPNWEISAVFADRPCVVFNWCRANGQRTMKLNFDRSRQVETLLPELHGVEPAVIVTNITKIIVPEIVEAFAGRVINLHYSLLPAYSGLIEAGHVKAALDDRRALVGCTVHHVTPEVDSGPAIAQVAIPVLDNRQEKEITNAVFRAGATALLASIAAFSRDRPANVAEILAFGDRDGLYSGPAFDFGKIDDDIWAVVRDAVSPPD